LPFKGIAIAGKFWKNQNQIGKVWFLTKLGWGHPQFLDGRVGNGAAKNMPCESEQQLV